MFFILFYFSVVINVLVFVIVDLLVPHVRQVIVIGTARLVPHCQQTRKLSS